MNEISWIFRSVFLSFKDFLQETLVKINRGEIKTKGGE